jgi:hypothetical protein
MIELPICAHIDPPAALKKCTAAVGDLHVVRMERVRLVRRHDERKLHRSRRQCDRCAVCACVYMCVGRLFVLIYRGLICLLRSHEFGTLAPSYAAATLTRPSLSSLFSFSLLLLPSSDRACRARLRAARQPGVCQGRSAWRHHAQRVRRLGYRFAVCVCVPSIFESRQGQSVRTVHSNSRSGTETERHSGRASAQCFHCFSARKLRIKGFSTSHHHIIFPLFC